MATHAAIAAVSRTLRTLLLDRMTTSAAVTLAPTDVSVSGVDGARVNLYLFHLVESPCLKNQEIPGHGHPAAYGRPPLSLDLRYLVTTHSATDDQPDSDLNAQAILGDAMRVFHFFGNRLDSLAIVNPAAGLVGDPVLDPVLREEFERVKVVLHPANLDDLTKVWSALSEENFRRSVVYEATVVQIEHDEPRPSPRPVERRRLVASVRRRPAIRQAYVTPGPGEPIGELRARVGDEITIVAEHTLADRLFVRLGRLEPIRVSPPGDGRIRLAVPDDQYPVDLDHPAVRPIPPGDRLQPGAIEVQVVAEHPVEAVEGGLDAGVVVETPRRYASNVALLQLVPDIATTSPAAGTAATILQLTGTRLWHARARTAEVIVGDAAVAIRAPAPGDPWAAPTPTLVEVPIAEAAALLPSPSAGGDPYPIAVQVDGVRSRDTGVVFTLQP
jgi:Pvc16 N-terminal domain